MVRRKHAALRIQGWYRALLFGEILLGYRQAKDRLYEDSVNARTRNAKAGVRARGISAGERSKASIRTANCESAPLNFHEVSVKTQSSLEPP